MLTSIQQKIPVSWQTFTLIKNDIRMVTQAFKKTVDYSAVILSRSETLQQPAMFAVTLLRFESKAGMNGRPHADVTKCQNSSLK